MLTPLLPLLADEILSADAGLMDWLTAAVQNGWVMAAASWALTIWLAKRFYALLKERDGERVAMIQARDTELHQLRGALLEAHKPE